MLSQKLEVNLLYGTGITASFDPLAVIPIISDCLNDKEVHIATSFLNWVNENNKEFGIDIQDIYDEYEFQCTTPTINCTTNKH